MVEFQVQNWEESYTQTFRLFEKIKDSGFIPDVIVGIARGGWIPARLLSDFFALKFTANIKVEAYQLIGEVDVEAKVTQKVNASIDGKNILIVDDIADTGSSLEVVLKEVKSMDVGDIKIATLYYKPHSSITPDYFIEETEKWIVFSWEYFETIQELHEKWKGEGKSEQDIVAKLKQVGIPPTMVNSYFLID